LICESIVFSLNVFKSYLLKNFQGERKIAGLDRMYDTQGDIQLYIEKKIKGLLEDPMNEYQDPNWVQAATLFKHVVVPCENYRYESLYALAKDITTESELHNNKVVYQTISGMYNQKVIDLNDAIEDCEVFKYDSLIDTIKKWMMDYKNQY